jgi:chromosome segregation ATPase
MDSYGGSSPRRTTLRLTDIEENQITDEHLMTTKNNIMAINSELDNAILNLNEEMDRKLKKQEHDYLKGYSQYVKNKEQELRKIIKDLNNQNQGSSHNEEVIFQLKNAIKRMNSEQQKLEAENKDLAEKAKYWRARCEGFEHDKTLMQNLVIESKRKNKLLKQAISRLQADLDSRKQATDQEQSPFVTALKQASYDRSLFESNQSMVKSHYEHLPSRNLKFERFIDEIFQSKMQALDVKDHIIKYVQALETNYSSFIQQMKLKT